MDDIDIWMEEKSYVFLEKTGVKKDQYILDFGCRNGTYTIPIAKKVGKKGRVYALDKDSDKLDELMDKTKDYNINNIIRIDVSEKIDIPGNNNFFDMVFLFDVIHLVDDKKLLLDEIKRVLKTDGRLVLYPRHHKEDMNLDLDGVIDFIKENNFVLKEKIYAKLIHDYKIVNDNVLIFNKKNIS